MSMIDLRLNNNKAIESMTNYLIYDEDGDLMRVVGRQEEARHIVSNHEGWTFKLQRIVKRDGYSEALLLGEALF